MTLLYLISKQHSEGMQGTHRACVSSCGRAVMEAQLAGVCLALLGGLVVLGFSIHYICSFHLPVKCLNVEVLTLKGNGIIILT